MHPDTKRPGLLDDARKSSTGASSQVSCCGVLLTEILAPEDLGRKEIPGFPRRFGNGFESAEGEPDHKNSRYDATNGKRMGRYEKDDARPRRRNAEDEGDVKNRRDVGERTRWGARGPRDDADTKHEDDGGKTGAGRDHEKFTKPWVRGAKIPDSSDDARRDERKPQDWRGGQRAGQNGGDRGWDRNDRIEAEPEWMDAGEDDEDPLQSKTMQDFEQWKQRMKSGGVSTEAQLRSEAEQPQAVEEGVSKVKVPTRSAKDDAMDKFSASFGAQSLDTVKQEAAIKAPTKSRFANMFGAPVEVPTKLPTPPPNPLPPPQAEPAERPLSSAQALPLGNADQEGFQRILQMLQTRSNNATPQTQRPGSSQVSSQQTDNANRGQEQSRPISEASRVKPPREGQPRRANESMLEGLLNIRSPPVQTHRRQESNNDDDERQVLLQLLGQADSREQKRSQMRNADPRQMPGLQAAYSNMNQQASVYNQQLAAGANSRQQAQQERPLSFFNEPPLFNTAEPSLLRRRPTNEQALPPFFDETAYRNSLLQNGQHTSSSDQVHGPPPGLGRPPGFDQMRSVPGFGAQQQLQGQPRQAGPPPGIPHIPMQQRGLPAQFQPPMPMPGQGQAPQRRKYTGDQGLAIPPGMRAPPGYGPEIPGFGPQNYGRFQVGSEQQGISRDLHDNRYGVGRASGMPGAYR